MASHQSPGGSKRPRLSLQTKTQCAPASSIVDPTSFNTLSNAYVTAIQRSSPAALSEPITAINTLQAFTLATPAEHTNAKSRILTPYIASFPETPLTAHPASPAQLQLALPSTMTATPPLSAETPDAASSAIFTFSASEMPSSHSPLDRLAPRRRAAPHQSTGFGAHLPYSHPRSLHSILRNSPLLPRTAIPPPSPRRQSLRLQEKAAKKVGYNVPLTQEIVTNKYTKSHIELLGDDGSPGSPSSPAEPDGATNVPLAFTANEVRDGGQTPSPFGGVHGTPAIADTFSPAAPSGARKRKRRRQWVWTIGQDDDDDDDDEAAREVVTARPAEVDGALLGPQPCAIGMPGFHYLETPTPSVESASSVVDPVDVGMSDACIADSSDDGLSDLNAATELDLKTPVAPSHPGDGTGRELHRQRDTPIPELCEERDTPVPPELT